MRSEELTQALLIGSLRVNPYTGGEAPLPIRAAARLPIIAPVGRLIFQATTAYCLLPTLRFPSPPSDLLPRCGRFSQRGGGRFP